MALATTTNRNYPIVDDAPTSYLDTIIIPALADLANLIDVDVQTLITGKIATTALDTDGTLAANDDAKIASQKATKTYANSVGAAAIAASQPLAARLTAIVATGIAASMFATNVLDTDATLSANDNARIASQSAVKSYVDNAITGVFWKPAADVATTGNITLSGEQTIDGVLTSASRVLVKAQTTASQNGLYLSGAGAWTRVAEADTGFEIWGATVMVKRGTVGANTQWTNTNTAQPTLGSTSITFAQISGAGTYSATGGVILTGNQFSADTGTSGHKLPWLDGANTWSAAQIFSGNVTVTNGAGLSSMTASGDIRGYRSGGTTGYHFFNAASTAYLGFDGTNFTFQVPGASNVNLGGDPLMTRGATETLTGVKTFTNSITTTNALAITLARASFDQWQIVHGTANTMAGMGILQATAGLYAFWIAASTQNVGIGTVDPAAKLHVSGALGTGVIRLNNTGGMMIDMQLSGTRTGQIFSDASNFILQSGAVANVMQLAWASGNVTFSGTVNGVSDGRFKNIVGDFTRGLADMLKMDGPKTFTWKDRKGAEAKRRYSGWIAQDVQLATPEAVTEIDGRLVVEDRPIIAMHHNAIIELNAELKKLRREVTTLRKAA